MMMKNMEKKSSIKKSIYNILSSLMGQVFTIILGIIIPRLYLVNFGSEINGLLNSVNQIYVYFGLLEAGVGTATLQALYKPVAEGDENSISRIMAATDKFYRKTGIIYFIGIMVFSIIYPLVVKSDVPETTIFAVILLNGIPGVVGYFLQGKYTLLLQAEGKQYISINLTTISTILINITRIILVVAGFNIIVVQTAYLTVSLLRILCLMIYIRKHYKWINLNAEPDVKAISQKNSVLVMQITDMIFRNTDVLILTFFCDLKVVSVYSMYTMIFSMISTFLDAFTQGFSFALGQIYNTDREKYIKLHDVYETYRMTLVFALYSVAHILITPFLKLYTAGVTDIAYIDKYLPLLFVLTYLLSCGRASSASLINYAQHFKLTKNRCIAEAIINVAVSVVCVIKFGIYGVLFGTIVSLLYRANDMIIYANKRILHRSPLVTYKRWLILFTVYFGIILFCDKFVNIETDSYITLFLYGVICLAVISIIFFATISAFEPKQAKEAFKIAKIYFKRLKSK